MHSRRPTTATARSTAHTPAPGAHARESRAPLRGSMRAAVVARRHLHVLDVSPPVRHLVLDPKIGELDMPTVVRESMRMRPVVDVLTTPRRPIAVGTMPIAVLQEALMSRLSSWSSMTRWMRAPSACSRAAVRT